MNVLTSTLIAMLLGSAPDSAIASPGKATSDDTAAREARTQVERTMNAFASADLAAFKAGLAEDVVSFEMDLEGKPVRLGSRNDAERFAQEVFAEMRKMGATMKLDFHSNDCHASSTMVWCIVEFDFQARMPDGSIMSQPSRNTIILRKGKDGWAWTHWHSSLASVPAPAAQ